MSFQSIAMVRTRGGSRLRQRVRFSTLEREEQPQFQLRSRPQYQLQSLRQSLRSLRDSNDTRLGWDPGSRHLCLSGDLGGPGPPRGAVHQARVSHPHSGLNHRQPHPQRRLHFHCSCHLPPGLGGRCLSGTPFRGMLHYTRATSIRSLTTMSRHWRLIPGSVIR